MTECLIVCLVSLLIVGPIIGSIWRGDGGAIVRSSTWAAVLLSTTLVLVVLFLQGGISSMHDFMLALIGTGIWAGLWPILFVLIWFPTVFSAGLVGPWAFRRWPREFWRDHKAQRNI